MQSKNFKKSYLLNLLQTIDNNQYNLKANKGKKIYNPSIKKGIKYKPETDLKSGKRFTPQNLPDYSTAEQKLHKTDKTLYARDVLKGHIEPEFINEIISTINKPELDYLYNSAPYIINQLDKNYNKSAITPEIFIEFLQSLYKKQNLSAVEKEEQEEDEDSGSEPDLSHIPYLTDEDLLNEFQVETQQNADLMDEVEEAEAEAEGYLEALQAPLIEEEEPEQPPKKQKAKSKKQKQQEVSKTLETSFYFDPIKSFKEFKKINFKKEIKQAILEEKFDELSPFFTYLGQPIDMEYIRKLKVGDLNSGFKKFFEE